MKTVWLIALTLLVSCSRNAEKKGTPAIDMSAGDASSFVALAKDKPMYLKLSQFLDLSKITRIRGRENVLIYMTTLKDKPTHIYAISTLGNELLYAGDMKDAQNGSIGLMKEGEAIIIDFNQGSKAVRDVTGYEFSSRFAAIRHGGTGFCQREAGESFSTCFRAESDEFCDSFVSCVALATQPSVAIIIGIACSCNALIQRV